MREATTKDVVKHQRTWLINNFVAVALIASFSYLSTRGHYELGVDLGLGSLAANTIADFVFSWRFYFPQGPREQPAMA
jgi:hypothetical protein